MKNIWWFWICFETKLAGLVIISYTINLFKSYTSISNLIRQINIELIILNSSKLLCVVVTVD